MTETKTTLDWSAMTDAEKCAAVAVAAGLPVEFMSAGANLWSPDYLHDPRAWWPLVEEMDRGCTVSKRVAPDMGGKNWTCSNGAGNTVHAVTPGEAVCIAYLRSKGVEVVTLKVRV